MSVYVKAMSSPLTPKPNHLSHLAGYLRQRICAFSVRVGKYWKEMPVSIIFSNTIDRTIYRETSA